MKGRALLKHLKEHGCEPRREGTGHSIYQNARTATAPAFRDIPRSTTRRRVKSALSWRFHSRKLGFSFRFAYRAAFVPTGGKVAESARWFEGAASAVVV